MPRPPPRRQFAELPIGCTIAKVYCLQGRSAHSYYPLLPAHRSVMKMLAHRATRTHRYAASRIGRRWLVHCVTAGDVDNVNCARAACA
eukprot:9225843-Pyramimonas_sp.AAC.1